MKVKQIVLTLFLSKTQAFTPTCSAAVERLKAGPANYLALTEAHADSEFTAKDQLYWSGYTSVSDINTFNSKID